MINCGSMLILAVFRCVARCRGFLYPIAAALFYAIVHDYRGLQAAAEDRSKLALSTARCGCTGAGRGWTNHALCSQFSAARQTCVSNMSEFEVPTQVRHLTSHFSV